MKVGFFAIRFIPNDRTTTSLMRTQNLPACAQSVRESSAANGRTSLARHKIVKALGGAHGTRLDSLIQEGIGGFACARFL